jgi:hypothetical protein
VVSYADVTDTTIIEGGNEVACNGTAPVVVASSPGVGPRRVVKNVYFANLDTVSHTVTLLQNSVPVCQTTVIPGGNADLLDPKISFLNGTGTAARLTKWVSPSLLGSSQLQETVSGGPLSFSGTLTAPRTATFPDATITVAGLQIAQTFTVSQNFSATGVGTNSAVVLTGSGNVSLGLTATSAAVNNKTWDWFCTGTTFSLRLLDDTNSSVGAGLIFTRSGLSISGVTMQGVVTLPNATASTLPSNGALIVAGGVGVSGALNVAGAVKTSGTLNVGGVTSLADTTSSTSPTTGALVVTGGIGAGGDLNVGGYLSCPALRTSVATNPGMATGSLTFSANPGRKIELYQSNTSHMGLGTDVGGGFYEFTIFGAAGPASVGFINFGFVTEANPGTFLGSVGKIYADGGWYVGSSPTSPGANNLQVQGVCKLGTIGSTFSGNVIAGVQNGTASVSGQVGEQLVSTVSATALGGTGVTTNVTSLLVPPGAWDMKGFVVLSSGATGFTNSTNIYCAINTVSATLGTTGLNTAMQTIAALIPSAFHTLTVPTTGAINISTTTTFYLITQGTYAAGSPTAAGTIIATRIR